MDEVEAVARAIEDQLTAEDGWMVGTPALSSMCRDFAQAAIAALDAARGKAEPFQSEVHNWMLACFGADIAADQVERVALLRQQNADGARGRTRRNSAYHALTLREKENELPNDADLAKLLVPR